MNEEHGKAVPIHHADLHPGVPFTMRALFMPGEGARASQKRPLLDDEEEYKRKGRESARKARARKKAWIAAMKRRKDELEYTLPLMERELMDIRNETSFLASFYSQLCHGARGGPLPKNKE